MAFVAERRNPDTGLHDIVGIGRLVKSHTANEAELAVIVSDSFQRRGIGTEMVRLLVDFGRQEQLDRITATVLHENRAMQKIFEKLGFNFPGGGDHDSLEAELRLGNRN